MANSKKNERKKLKINSYHPDITKKSPEYKELNIAHNNIQIQYYTYNQNTYKLEYPYTVDDCEALDPVENGLSWLNVDGINEEVTRKIGKYYDIDELQIDDALSIGQRAKLDDYDQDKLFLLLPMLHLNEAQEEIEVEQISIVVHPKQIITFQQEHLKDPFNKLRLSIKSDNGLVRKKLKTEFLLHQLLDAIIDEYFSVLDFINNQLENIENLITNQQTHKEILAELSAIRKNILFIKRSIVPVKDIIDSLYIAENNYVSAENRKYYKDLLDHIIIAIEYADTYKELANNLKDTYMNIINAKSNDVMKILTVVTTILAPFTVLSSIYGMNFDKLPFMHAEHGFYYLIAFSFIITVGMLFYFKAKRWF